jgi:hypothetical protein
MSTRQRTFLAAGGIAVLVTVAWWLVAFQTKCHQADRGKPIWQAFRLDESGWTANRQTKNSRSCPPGHMARALQTSWNGPTAWTATIPERLASGLNYAIFGWFQAPPADNRAF